MVEFSGGWGGRESQIREKLMLIFSFIFLFILEYYTIFKANNRVFVVCVFEA